jgi:hypothetical protein
MAIINPEREEGPEHMAGRKSEMWEMRICFKSHPQPFRL